MPHFDLLEIIKAVGYVGLFLIIFAETGLFLGFFLPGDSLLFTAGIFIKELAASFYHINYLVVVLLIILASFIGSMLGYWIGFRTGPQMFKWKDKFLFKKKYLLR